MNVHCCNKNNCNKDWTLAGGPALETTTTAAGQDGARILAAGLAWNAAATQRKAPTGVIVVLMAAVDRHILF